jgi:flagellar motor switch protein FliN
LNGVVVMNDPSSHGGPAVSHRDAGAPGSIASSSDANGSLLRSLEGMSFVMEVPVELTVELGRRNIRIGEVLRLGPGAVLELTKANGEPLDIYVNNRLVARGEAVVVGERYGVRLTEVIVTESSTKGGEER